MIVADDAIAAPFLEASLALDGVGAKVGRAVAGKQVVPLEIGEAFEEFASLEVAKQIGD